VLLGKRRPIPVGLGNLPGRVGVCPWARTGKASPAMNKTLISPFQGVLKRRFISYYELRYDPIDPFLLSRKRPCPPRDGRLRPRASYSYNVISLPKGDSAGIFTRLFGVLSPFCRPT